MTNKLEYIINTAALDLFNVDREELIEKVKTASTDNITHVELVNLAAETAIAMSTKHYNYNTVATRIVINNLHSTITHSFSGCIELLDDLEILNKDFVNFVKQNQEKLDTYIKHQRDFFLDYFGYKTLEKAYLHKVNSKIVETPQYMFMRVATAIHLGNLEAILQTYDDLSQQYYIHATPTLFNSGMRNQQLSSCYLVAMKEDSIDGIYETLKECAQISKWAGGIGVHIHQIRGKNSKIRSNNGTSDGIVPMLKVFNDTARYCNQAGKRPGSIAVYIEPWHCDIDSFIDLKKNHGNEDERARDLFYALWIPDLFMRRVEENGDWYLMCPNECPGLQDVHSAEFDALYNSYVSAGKYRKCIAARDLWTRILHSQIETGTPYMLYKDSANNKSNQKHLGTIKSSNLCCEVILYSDMNETAVCNLASIGLPTYISQKVFNHSLLGEKVRNIVRNLNRVIDINFYPTECARRSNMRHRPIGLGVQGLADVFMEMDMDWETTDAHKLNSDIFETIYYYSLLESVEQAKLYGPYETFSGSPASQGILQFDMWPSHSYGSLGYDWNSLKEQVKTHGLRNSVLVSPMPTASTSQILGFTECFEPINSNIFTRRTLAGSFVVMNHRLMEDLIELGLWNEDMKNEIIRNDGSVQDIASIPKPLKDKYKTVWEIKQKTLIDMSADRGRYICQSQSLNLYLPKIDINRLGSMHLYAWKQGLKTGLYYLRIKPVAKTQQFTVEPVALTNKAVTEEKETKEEPEQKEEKEEPVLVCRREAGCITCSS
jgi:ribonucleoside-diphosphate reductase alpha chain